MTYLIHTHHGARQITEADLVRLLGRDNAESLIDGWTIRGWWRVW